jgi:hypothetical protein
LAANFHDALTQVYRTVDGLPPLFFGVAPKGAWDSPPFNVADEIDEDPSYGSTGVQEYVRASTTMRVYDLNADKARAAAKLVRDALTVDCLAVDGYFTRLWQGKYRERFSQKRGPNGEYLFVCEIPLVGGLWFNQSTLVEV